jgi:hypothetical protein
LQELKIFFDDFRDVAARRLHLVRFQRAHNQNASDGHGDKDEQKINQNDPPADAVPNISNPHGITAS